MSYPCLHCGGATQHPNDHCDACERAYQEAEDAYVNGCPNCAASGWHASAMTGWDAVSCRDCNGTGYRTVERVPYGNPSDVEQVDDRCACNPEPTDEEHPLYETYCEDYGDHIGSWQNDTAEYRRLHMPRFPSFSEWLNRY